MRKKIIVISGGSSGLGFGVATELCSCDNTIIILSNDEKELEKAAKKLHCEFRVCDVRSPQMCEAVVQQIIKKHKRIDVLVNNAGMYVEGALEQMTSKKIEQVYAVNTLGTIYLTRAVLPHMKKRGQGDIFNVISRAGLTTGLGRTIYNSTKWAITGFTKCLREDEAQHGIRVMGIYPGKIKTSFIKRSGVKASMKDAMPVKDVVHAICYMISQPRTTVVTDLSIQHINH